MKFPLHTHTHTHTHTHVHTYTHTHTHMHTQTQRILLLHCNDGEAGEVAQVPVTTPSLVTNNTFVDTVTQQHHSVTTGHVQQ